MSLLESKDDKVRLTAVDAVNSLLYERPDLMERVVPMLSDPSAVIRLHAATKLESRLKPAILLPILLEEMRGLLPTSNSYPFMIGEYLASEISVSSELREEAMKAFIEVISDPMQGVSKRMAACEVFESRVVPDDAVLAAMHAFAAERILKEDSQEHLATIIKKHEAGAEAEAESQ